MFRRLMGGLVAFSLMAGGVVVVAGEPPAQGEPGPDGKGKGPKGGKHGGKGDKGGKHGGKGGPGGKKGPPPDKGQGDEE
jgi:hypothetical protein